MGCENVKLPGGGMAIVCGRGRRGARCGWCTQRAGLLCDWKVGKGKTCDAKICNTHAQEVAPEKHLCPEHQTAYKAWLARRSAPPATQELGSDEERQADADEAHALGLDWKGG
jgi:hypothetical protein